MKKIAYILGGLIVLALVIGVVAMFKLNGDYGFTEASAISHETLATEDTRVRAVIQMDKVRGYLQRFVPADAELPAIVRMLPWKAQDLVASSIPRELAILASPTKDQSAFEVVLFVNERRGGPQLAKAINGSTLFSTSKPIAWNTDRMVMARRGVLEARGSIPIPAGLLDYVHQTWPAEGAGGEPYLVGGDNFIEIKIDNRGGELITLVASILHAQGQDWSVALRQNIPEGSLAVLRSVTDITLDANPASLDKMKINLRLNAQDNSPSGLTFIFNGAVIPSLQQQLQAQGLTLKGEAEWVEAENALVGKFEVTGLEALINSYIPKPVAAPGP